MEREFTLEEANEAVVELRPVVERMVAHGRKLAGAQREQRQLVTRIAASSIPLAPALDCARGIKRMRWDRERAAIQREIDRLQELGAGQHGNEIDALWQRKIDLLHRIEKLT